MTDDGIHMIHVMCVSMLYSMHAQGCLHHKLDALMFLKEIRHFDDGSKVDSRSIGHTFRSTNLNQQDVSGKPGTSSAHDGPLETGHLR